MVLNGDVVSTGDIVNAGEIRFDNQTTPDAALSRAVAKGDSPVTFHKLTTSNLTGQGGTINMRVRLDGSNTSDQLVINGGQATAKPGLRLQMSETVTLGWQPPDRVSGLWMHRMAPPQKKVRLP